MRWYKHFTDNHRGRTVQRLLDEVGHKGVVCYYFLMEMCAEKLEKSSGSTLSESDCTFTFNMRVIVAATRCTRATIESVLAVGATTAVWRAEANAREIVVVMPILLDLLDKDLKRARQARGLTAQNAPLDKNRIDKDNITPPTSSEDPIVPIDAYNAALLFPKNEAECVNIEKQEKTIKQQFDLEAIYAMYPRKEGKKKGMERLKAKIKKKEDYEKLLISVKNYVTLTLGKDRQYLKHFDSFVSVWEDYLGIAEDDPDDLSCKIDWDSINSIVSVE